MAEGGTPEGTLVRALRRGGRPILEGHWAVQDVTSATQFTVQYWNPAGVVPYVGPALAGVYLYAPVEFVTGVLSGTQPGGGAVGTGRFLSLIQSVASTVSNGTVTTTVTVADAMPVNPQAGDRFLVYQRPTALEVEVTTDPVNIANVLYGTAVTAGTPVLSTTYSVPQNGTVVGHVALAPSGTSTTVQYTVDGTHYVAINQGQALTLGAGYAFAVPVLAGDAVNFTTGANTTLAVLQAFFMPTQ